MDVPAKKKKKGLSPGLLAYMAKQRALKAGKAKKQAPAKAKPKAKPAAKPAAKPTAKAKKTGKRKAPRRAVRPLYENTGVAGIVPPVPEKRLSEPSQAETRPLY